MEGKLIAGRYRLERKLGEGAMGSVWLAEHLTLGTEVAVKVINAEAARNKSARARFEREALLVARLRSKHVVGVLDHGTTDDDQSYIVMEYLIGESLGDRLDARGRLTPEVTARVVRQVCRAMTKAHDEGLVHRDLKPDNIFLAIEGEDDERDEVAKVLDFGVAKATDILAASGVDPTRTGALLGTPYYMSPEQAQGLKTVDHRADLWSMGVIVYECLTGTRPFTGSALGRIVARIIGGAITPPSELAPDNAYPAIDQWMMRALERDPDERFQSAKELSDAFAEAVHSSGIVVRRSSSRPPPSAEAPAPNVGDYGSGIVDEVTDRGTVIVRDDPDDEEPVAEPALSAFPVENTERMRAVDVSSLDAASADSATDGAAAASAVSQSLASASGPAVPCASLPRAEAAVAASSTADTGASVSGERSFASLGAEGSVATEGGARAATPTVQAGSSHKLLWLVGVIALAAIVLGVVVMAGL